MAFAIDFSQYSNPAYASTMPAAYQRAVLAEGRPLPFFGLAGTGGVESDTSVERRLGYRIYTVVKEKSVIPVLVYEPYIDLMQEVQAGFGRTLSHLPAVFGVSRQALYNWMKGEVPKEQHRDKLVQLAEAAKVFSHLGFKPTAELLERTVAKGKSFIELLGDGANGEEVANKLVRIVRRAVAERESLKAQLGDRESPRLTPADMGRQSFPESV